jgi:Xaa-Pro aminopeptidase
LGRRVICWLCRLSWADCVPPDRRLERQAALRRGLEAEGLDGLLVTHLPNIRYLTGFSGSAALLLVRHDTTVLITDFRYAAQATVEAGTIAMVEIDQRSVWERLGRVLGARPLDTLGIEPHSLTVRDAERVGGLTRGRVVPSPELVERQRAVKDPQEVAAIRAAAVLAQEALGEVLAGIRVGRTEVEVGAALESALRRRGSEWHPFPTIVASGPRSALPHARTSQRVIGAGELLLLDFGAQVDGYCADLTRMVVVGARADERQRTVHDLVQTAQRRAIEHLRAGMPAREGDALAREVIATRGFGDAFGHSLGHGLGLEVHEAPRLAPNSEAPLPEHAVVTVEPGVYFPGWGGVRLEDDVYLGSAGPERLSDGRTELLELV